MNNRVMSGQKFIDIDPPEQDLFSNFYYRHTLISEFIKGILRDLQVSQEFLTREVIVGHDALIYPKNRLQFKKKRKKMLDKASVKNIIREYQGILGTLWVFQGKII